MDHPNDTLIPLSCHPRVFQPSVSTLVQSFATSTHSFSTRDNNNAESTSHTPPASALCPCPYA